PDSRYPGHQGWGPAHPESQTRNHEFDGAPGQTQGGAPGLGQGGAPGQGLGGASGLGRSGTPGQGQGGAPGPVHEQAPGNGSPPPIPGTPGPAGPRTGRGERNGHGRRAPAQEQPSTLLVRPFGGFGVSAEF